LKIEQEEGSADVDELNSKESPKFGWKSTRSSRATKKEGQIALESGNSKEFFQKWLKDNYKSKHKMEGKKKDKEKGKFSKKLLENYQTSRRKKIYH
jgi:hypothetical protein